MTVLVAYSSKRGSTAEIAETVAATLRREGLGVCLEPVEGVDSLDPYDAVVLGSAVYMKRWRGDAKHFLKKHRKALKQKPFWVFSSGPVGDPAKDDPEWMEPP
jgi:menaquinone-dependent protoporphyrinogen oxidase